MTFARKYGMIITTKENTSQKLAKASADGSQAIGFPRFKDYPFEKTILYQKGGARSDGM